MTFVLPDSRFGMSTKQYRVPDMPERLPDKASVEAANELNRIRYQQLTYRQRTWLDDYLGNGFDGDAASLVAGYPEKDARRVANKMLKNPDIKAALDWAMTYHAERNAVRLTDIIEELKIVAFSSMGDFFINDGNGDPHLRMPEDGSPALRAISEITCESYMEGKGPAAREIKRVKFKKYDKLAALEKLIKIVSPQIAALEAAQAAAQNPGSNNTFIGTVNIVPVPANCFLPAAELDKGPIELDTSNIIDYVSDESAASQTWVAK